jgi:hypothetical protein
MYLLSAAVDFLSLFPKIALFDEGRIQKADEVQPTKRQQQFALFLGAAMYTI